MTMDNLDHSKPNLDYSNADILWKIYHISWKFPKFMSPLVLKFLLNLIYFVRYFEFIFHQFRQQSIVKQAIKMGVPVSQNTTFVGLNIFRDLAKNPFYLSKCLSGKLLIEYLKVRGRVTIDNMCESGKVFAKGDWKKWKADIFSDEFFHFSILNQTIAFYLIKSEISEFDYQFYFSGFDYSDLYSFGIQDVRKIYINKDDHQMLIVMRNGDEIRNGDKYWDLAKLYAQSAIYYYTLTYAHNWVHFNYPDVVVSKTYSMISDKSVFFQLMEPHIRYVSMTNNNGLSGRASARHIGVSSEYIRPDVHALVTQSELAEGLARRSIAFYSRENIEIAKDTLATNLRFGFPHEGFKESEIPYLKNLYRIYIIVRNFVDSVYENIKEEHRDIERWKGDILKLFPYINAKEVNTVDFIATFIWQSAFIHSIDHATTSAIYNNNRRVPIYLRKSFDLSSNMELEEMYHPMDLMTAWGVGHSFLDYNKSAYMDDSLTALDYHFKNYLLISKQDKFKKEINEELISNWTFNFEKEEEIKIRMDNISTSISF
jgi:hypothetical protein